MQRRSEAGFVVCSCIAVGCDMAFGLAPSPLLTELSASTRAPHVQRVVRPQCLPASYRRRVPIVCRRGAGRPRERRRGDGRRPFRVGQLIRREISCIIDSAFSRAFEVDRKLPVMVSVVGVSCSDDLRNAKVSVSVLGNEEQKNLVFKWLKDSRKSLRFELAQSVQMKHVPELTFKESEMAQAVKTVDILERLAQERAEKERIATAAGVTVPPPQLIFDDEELELDATADGAILDVDEDGTGDIAPSYSTRRQAFSVDADDDAADDDDDDDNDLLIVDIDAQDDDELDEGMLEKIRDQQSRRSFTR